MEQLLIVGATVVPCFVAVLICEKLIQEYLGFEVVILTSPFF